MTSEQWTKEAFELFHVTSFKDLHKAYVKEDQRLMKARQWTIKNAALRTNKLREILARIDHDFLSKEDAGWYHEIMWFWYHHAISTTSWVHERRNAETYALYALSHQIQSCPRGDHPNRITQLLYYLVRDEVAEAKLWMAEKPARTDPVEHQTGLDIIRDYERFGPAMFG